MGNPWGVWSSSLHLTLESPFCSGQIVICGDPQAKDTKALLQCVHSIYIPNKVRVCEPGTPPTPLPSPAPRTSPPSPPLEAWEWKATVGPASVPAPPAPGDRLLCCSHRC